MANISNSRLRRVQASARSKKIADLEKSLSHPEDDGTGPKAKATADDSYKRDKANKPRAKGDKSNSQRVPQSSVQDTKKTKQQAIDEAEAKLEELTTETPPLKPTPKPKIISAAEKRRALRKQKIAELKTALEAPMGGSHAAPDSEMDAESLSDKDVMPHSDNAANDQQRKPAFKVLQISQEVLPKITQSLTQANDMLEDAVMGNKLPKIKGALVFLLTKINEIAKQDLVPMGATIRRLVEQLPAPTPERRQASTKRRKLAAAVHSSSHMLDTLNAELLRSKQLMRMASNAIPSSY